MLPPLPRVGAARTLPLRPPGAKPLVAGALDEAAELVPSSPCPAAARLESRRPSRRCTQILQHQEPKRKLVTLRLEEESTSSNFLVVLRMDEDRSGRGKRERLGRDEDGSGVDKSGYSEWRA